MTFVSSMKKKVNSISYKQGAATSKAEEPLPVYRSVKALPQVKDFTYSEFKKIADKTPFTQAEWASILHVSERTLQRYAKNNGSFAPINAERAVQIEKVIKEGKVPDDWNKSWMVNVYKGKGDALECGSYRGIKLLDMKVLERVIEGRVRKIV